MHIQREQPTHEIADVEGVTIEKRGEKSRKLTFRFVAPEQLAGVGVQGSGAIRLGSIDADVLPEQAAVEGLRTRSISGEFCFAVDDVGAFLVRENAEKLRERLAQRHQPVFIQEYDSPNGLFHRVRAGRLASQEEACQLAEQLRSGTQAEVTSAVEAAARATRVGNAARN